MKIHETETLTEIREAIAKAGDALSVKHKLFADEYLANGAIGTRAYLLAFKTDNPRAAAVGANKLLKRADVRAYIDLCKRFTTDELLNHMTITKDRILDEEAKLAFIDVRKMFDADGNFYPPQYWPEELARAVSGIDVDQIWDTISEKWRYKYKVKFSDKGAALKRLEQILGMHKLPEVGDSDRELVKSFIKAFDGESRGRLPSQIMDDEDEEDEGILDKYDLE